MTLALQLRAALQEGHSLGDTLPLSDVRDPRIQGDILLAPAAVLVAITDRPEPGLILTERSTALRKHAGQVAFPGGRVDPSDADEIAGALREAQEEIALAPDQVEVVGISDRYQTFTGFDIVPVLGVIPPDLPLRAQESEVAAWFEVPLAFALDPANRIRREVEYAGAMRPYYEIFWEGRRIWGITAAILANLSRRLGHDRLAA
ncbi:MULTISPECIES: CoA pyrophosphatase [Sphingobium]|jgi:8-oxo-dGTP pyrophosphatase MutT (NUDIX family)|uniref:CoA pyrophosphatase n=1 Tax=Sphingobium TaxID=165695 RepID=UPI000C5F3284|nr:MULTISPECIES: CoA pyrophosphatase [Sphingobium]MAP43713.1 CoA pyrophosphatase [Sphingobium sp.]MEC9017240.1 CoA pyrophosphatase [Pseudomonadota bacterium]MAX14334.1 CoA pyrophosphatase [Sphingobium sp.]MBA38763.1 CoA pyrophosphatase [Sphingobium sp.]MBS46618.1 CoA pyrophosphatase [Sphingobium sp.]|tara:strand:+ start:1009 stop:1620 length:612 start_codon:yes stop_codon:yes gene_type:complete